MACCAFIIFVIGQLYVALEIVSRRLGFSAPSRLWRPGAADWRPPSAGGKAIAFAPAAIPRAGRREIRVAAIVAISFGSLVAGVVISAHARTGPTDIRAILADPSRWCRLSLPARE